MSQRNVLIRHLLKKNTITNREAIAEHRIMALPRRIADLEEMGVEFKRHHCTNAVTGQRYVRYTATHIPHTLARQAGFKALA